MPATLQSLFPKGKAINLDIATHFERVAIVLFPRIDRLKLASSVKVESGLHGQSSVRHDL